MYQALTNSCVVFTAFAWIFGRGLISDSTFVALQVCKATGIEPSDIQYVEAHGTGTVVGDSQELMAIDGLYGAGAGHTPEEPLLIGSVKSNMGHCEGCSGLAGGLQSQAWECSSLAKLTTVAAHASWCEGKARA
jgi:hypothetical protein